MSKHALITGASRGIGLEVAKYFGSKGYDLSLISKTRSTLDIAAEGITRNFPGIKVNAYDQDVCETKAIYDLVENIAIRSGKIDVLFNNAGIAERGTSGISTDEFEKILNTNVMGAFAVIKAVSEHMKKNRAGYIFNLASNSGKRATAHMGAYAASKFALVGFSQALFREMLPFNVRVTSICPSVVATEMTSRYPFSDDKKIQPKDISNTIDMLLGMSPYARIETIDILCSTYIEEYELNKREKNTMVSKVNNYPRILD